MTIESGKGKKLVMLYGPPVDLQTHGLQGGAAGGYARNMSCYLTTLQIKDYSFYPLFHTVRADYSEAAFSKYRRFIIDMLRVLRALVKRRPQAVHVLAQYRDALPREVAALVVCKVFGVPFLYDIKAGAFVHEYNVRGKWYRIGIKYLVKSSDGILVEGASYVNFLQSNFGVSATFFPNFVPANDIPVDTPARLQKEQIEVLFVGRCYSGKGVFELVQGCMMAAENGVSLRLTLIGEEDADFKAFVEGKPIPEKLLIERLGNRPHQDVIERMMGSDVLCFPTRHSGEGHSNVINEAMMCGVVILTTRHGFIPDVLGEHGAFYLEEVSAEDISNKMQYIAANRKTAVDRSQKARLTLLKEFTSDAASQRIAHFYAEKLRAKNKS